MALMAIVTRVEKKIGSKDIQNRYQSKALGFLDVRGRGIQAQGVLYRASMVAAIALIMLVPTSVAMKDTIEPGDVIIAKTQVYDASTNILLFSTDASDESTLLNAKNSFDGEYVIPIDYKAFNHYINPDGSILNMHDMSYDPSILKGKSVGFGAEIPITGWVPGYIDSVHIDRLRGPFNKIMTVNVGELENLAELMGESDMILVGGLLPAKIISSDGQEAIIKFDLTQGERVKLSRIGFEAEVLWDEETDQFNLFLDADRDMKFSVFNGCNLGRDRLESGSYLAKEINPENIHLLRSPTIFPQLMNRDIKLSLVVDRVLDGDSLPRQMAQAIHRMSLTDSQDSGSTPDTLYNGQNIDADGRVSPGSLAELVGELGGSPQPTSGSSCSANGLLTDCTVKCGPGQSATCEVDLFMANCYCSPDSVGGLAIESVGLTSRIPLHPNTAFLAGMGGLAATIGGLSWVRRRPGK